MVIARTTEGDVGILPNHAPLLSSIIEGVVDVQTAEGETWIAAVDAGFLSVADNRVSILSERAEMSHEIDLEKARQDLERAKQAGENDDEAAGGACVAPRHASAPWSGPPDEARNTTARVSARTAGFVRSSASVACGGCGCRSGNGRSTSSGCACSSPCSTASPSSSGAASSRGTAARSSSATGPAPSIPGRGWLLGIGRYSGQSLEWFRIFSLSPRPKRVWARDLLEYAGRRAPAGAEEMSLYDGHVVASCRYDGEPLEIAMSEASLTGFQSWLESGPPGTDWNRR